MGVAAFRGDSSVRRFAERDQHDRSLVGLRCGRALRRPAGPRPAGRRRQEVLRARLVGLTRPGGGARRTGSRRRRSTTPISPGVGLDDARGRWPARGRRRRRVGVRAASPRNATSNRRGRSSLGDAAARVGHRHAGHALLGGRDHLAPRRPRGVPDGVDHAGSAAPGRAPRRPPRRAARPAPCRAAARPWRRASGSAPATVSDDQVAEPDAAAATAAARPRGSGTARTGRPPSRPAGRPRPASARGSGARSRVGDHPVLQRLGHGAQPGQRCTQVVADPGDELTPAGLQGALACVRGLQARVRGGQFGARARPARPGSDASAGRTGRLDARRAATSSALLSPTSRRPSSSDAPSPTSPATAVTVSATDRSWSEMSIFRVMATMPATVARTVAADTTASRTAIERLPQRVQQRDADAAGEQRGARGVRDDLGEVSRRDHVIGLISVTDAPYRARCAGVRSGLASIFSRSRRTWTVTVEESPNSHPQTWSSSSARVNA